MSRKDLDPLALIPTINDEDNDVPDLDGPDDEDDNDDEQEMIQKARAHKLAQATKGKSIDFNDQFEFLLVRKRRFCISRKYFALFRMMLMKREF